MRKKEHRARVEALLNSMNSEFLNKSECYLGGGTALSMSLHDYRESSDIDFLCSSPEGYRLLRNTITQSDLGDIFSRKMEYIRDVKADRYGIRANIKIDGIPIKIEIINEGRIQIEGDENGIFPVPVLSKVDFFTEKLLANADRWADKSAYSRDIIDLLVMAHYWGDIPQESWKRSRLVYGEQVDQSYIKSLNQLKNDTYLKMCIKELNISEEAEIIIKDYLYFKLENNKNNSHSNTPNI